MFAAEFFARAVEVMAALVPDRTTCPSLTLGGGLGVAYVEGEAAPTITEWGQVVRKARATTPASTARLLAEPGRAIVAAAAVTLYTVGHHQGHPRHPHLRRRRRRHERQPPPVLYGSGYETFLPRAVGADRPRPVRVVGKHCESGDVLVREALVPADLAVGDILATPVTGAYGHSMGTNYNKVPRPAVVFVADGEARVVVRRETYDDLLRFDVR